MRQAFRIAVIAWFFALICAPVALFLLGFRSGNVENRTLVPVPPHGLTDLARITTYRRANDALTDRLPLRDRAVAARAYVMLQVFHDNPSPADVAVGKDGWLFITDELVCDAPGVTAADISEQMDTARRAVTAAGKRFAMTFVPAKIEVESDHYGAPRSWEACARDRLSQLRRTVTRRPGYLDLWAPMEAATAAGEDTFLRTDSHLNSLGQLIYAQGLIDAADPVRARTIQLREGRPVRHLGDETLLTGWHEYEPLAPVVTTTSAQTPAPDIKHAVVVIGDSQTEDMLDDLSAVTGRFGFCHWDAGFWVGTCDAGLQQAGVIVVESVARAAWRRAEADFGKRILDAMLPVIPAEPGVWRPSPGVSVAADRSATLTAPSSDIGIAAPHDQVGHERLLRFALESVPAGAQPYVELQRHGVRLPGARTALADAPAGVEQALVVPAGIPMADVRLHIGSSPGTVVSAPRISRFD